MIIGAHKLITWGQAHPPSHQAMLGGAHPLRGARHQAVVGGAANSPLHISLFENNPLNISVSENKPLNISVFDK